MADPRYEIPGPVVPDLAPGFQSLAQAFLQQKQNRRADEYMRMEKEAIKARADRESAALKRQEEEDKRRHAIEAWSAMPMLQRAAAKSVGMANANPYGVHFDEQMTPTDQGPADNAVGDFLSHDQPPEPQHVDRQLLPTEEGPEQAPAAEAARFAGTDDLMSQATGGAPLDMLSAAAAGSFAPPTKKLTATYQGQTFDVPQVGGEKTPFGPKYDEMVNYFIDNGDSPKDAHARVVAIYKADQTQNAIADRTAQQIEARRGMQNERQDFQRGENEKYRNEGLTFEQRKELANIMARAKMASAGAAPVSPGVAKLVGMKEAGATDEEIYAEAAKLKLSQKDVAAPVQNVVKNAAASERAGQKREGLTATGEGTHPGDMWKSPQAATTGTKQIQRFHRVRDRLKALIAHVERYGERIDPDAQQYQDRMSLAEGAAAALRPYNELSSTDASMAAERAILGPAGAFGHGWTLGANLQGLKRILAEAESQQEENLATLLRPGGGSQLAPALGGPRPGAHPSQAPVGETRTGPDGLTYRKVGPNNWQPVEQ